MAPAATEVGLARSADELDAAFRLVHNRYVERGYTTPSSDGRRLTPYHALPSTHVFVARAGGRVVGTLSLITDAELGLPCDDLYPQELRQLRGAGCRLGEVAALAVARGPVRDGLARLNHLMQAVGVFGAHIARLDELCITVHPRHARFYESRLGFVRFGPLKRYSAVNDAPAVGLRLRLRDVRERSAEVLSRLAASLLSADAIGRPRGRSCEVSPRVAGTSLQVLHRIAGDLDRAGSTAWASLHAR